MHGVPAAGSGRSTKVDQLKHRLSIVTQRFLDAAVPWKISRWVFFCLLLVGFIHRFIALEGFYVSAYALGIFILNKFLLLLTPLGEPEDGKEYDGAALPSSGQDEFKPFVPRLLEFRLWLDITKAVFIALATTFFSVFDIPVFWPILLAYFVLLVFLSLQNRIVHMMQHKYVPWSRKKPTYVTKDN